MAADKMKMATAGILIGVFMSALDSTVVATIIPTIISRFGGSYYQLLVSGFVMAATISTPFYGKIADVVGYKNALRLSLLLFSLSSLICGISSNIDELILGRMVQGVGAGGLITVGYVAFAHMFPPEKRGEMQGKLSSVWGLAAIIGPVIGSVCVQFLSWRIAFFVNVPLSVIALYLIDAAVVVRKGESMRIDVLGAVLLVFSLTSFLSGVTMIGNGLDDMVSWLIFGIGVVAFCGFVLYERKPENPLIHTDLVLSRSFAPLMVVSLFGSMVLYACVVAIPLYMQSILMLTPVVVGLTVMEVSLGWVIGATVCGKKLNKLGYKKTAALGAALMLISCGLFVAMFDWSWLVYVASVLVGIGMGFVATSALILAQNSVRKEMLGVSTGLVNLARNIGAILGVSGLGGVQMVEFNNLVSHNPDARNIGVNGMKRLLFARSADTGKVRALRIDLTSSLRYEFILMFGFALALVVVALLIKDRYASALPVQE